MMVLVKLILAHFIGDFVLQPLPWVESKEKKKAKSLKFYLHVLLHGVLVLLVLWDVKYWFVALVLMFTHGIIDLLKLYAQNESRKIRWFLIDQMLHLLSIFVIWRIYFKSDINLLGWLEDENIWIYATALVFITFVSGIVIQMLMSNFSTALHEGNEASLMHAGKYIGILERLFVFTFVLTGNWQAIGFLLAAKSVFRFGDLKESKDRKLTEYILIGTLLSFGIAVATGMLVLALVR